jgi:hypothetical protein
MKKNIILLLLLLPFFTEAQDYQWGLGIRLGDPTGISIKRNMGELAWEFSFGRSPMWHPVTGKYDGRYEKVKLHPAHKYLGHRYERPIAFQFHLMANREIAAFSGLNWYVGAGPQIRRSRVIYT